MTRHELALTPGSRIGPYEITAQIGAGGMGEVYRARDTKLKRDVAAKVLPSALASDPDRLARFQREAEVLASLNHPGIASIYGLEDSGDVKALVMELVEGPTLAERLAAGPIPVDQALAIARQIADALEAAHDQGIVHRDLKPANIKVRDDGTVKVLDFGLAKAMDSAGSGQQAVGSVSPSLSPTITTPAMTQLGMILGTAAYMAPEQARGRVVDRRADIWAFGCVLYEMLTGRRAFDAEDVSLTLARVLERDVDLESLPGDVPPRVRQALGVCLRKDPKQRAGDIRDVRLALEGAFESPAPPAAPVAALTPAPPWRRTVPVGAALVVGLALGAMALGLVSAPASAPPAITQFEIPLGEGEGFTTAGTQVLDVTADGSRIVYIVNRRLYVRTMAELEARPLSGTDEFPVIRTPVFSPDGQWIVFWSSGGTGAGSLRKISVAGGVAVTLCEAASPFGLIWVGDQIVYGQGAAGILRVSANGGRPEQIVRVDEGDLAGYPHLLPDQQTLLFSQTQVGNLTAIRTVTQSLKTGERKTLIEGGADARYLSTGHLVYYSGGVVFAAPFDPERLVLTGGATPVVEGVRAGNNGAHMRVSETGTLVYVPGPVSGSASQWKVARVDRQGSVAALPIDPGPFSVVRVSPDGRQLALGTDDGKEAIIWIYDLMGTGAPRRLTFEGHTLYPVWSHDGQYVAFQSDKEGDRAIFRKRADGAGVAERLTKAEKGTAHIPESWAPDGSRLLYNSATDGKTTLWSLSMTDKTSSAVGGITSPSLTGAALSPDGHWVAYASREGRAFNAIFVEPFPPTGAKYQVSKNQDDGHHPVWTRDGAELVFTPGSGTRVSVVAVTRRPSFSVGEEQVLNRPFRNGAPSTVRNYDIAPDGQHFIALVDSAAADSGTAPERLRVVLNWTEELKRRVPVR